MKFLLLTWKEKMLICQTWLKEMVYRYRFLPLCKSCIKPNRNKSNLKPLSRSLNQRKSNIQLLNRSHNKKHPKNSQ